MFMNLTVALPTFVITLREGVEAALVVGIVLACLQKANQSKLNIWVYLGILAGIVASILVGFLLVWGIQQIKLLMPNLEPVIEPALKSIFCVTAIAMLSWMLIWMSLQARSLKSAIEGSITTTLQEKGSEFGVFTLIFIAVLREGFETVLFIFANLQQGYVASLGAIAGLAGAAAIGVALFKWGVKINIRLFFQVMGVLLLLIVAGLVVSAFKNIDATVYAIATINHNVGNLCFSVQSCVLGFQIWDTSQFLPDKQFPGIILKTMLGYRDRLYLLQALGYLLFLSVVGTLYFRSLKQVKIPNT
jgi:high-affinity iron transporter